MAGRHNHLHLDASAGSPGPHREAAPFSERDFLLQLGTALRGARTTRAMSRRELARRSGVSERYIALIEAGKGNVSVVLLLRILNVFRSDLTDAV